MPASDSNWIMVNAFEFANFMKTPEGQARKRNFGQLDACDKEDLIYVFECGHETAKQWRSDKDRHNYLLACERESGYITISYNCLSQDESVSGEEVIEDSNYDVEETVMLRLELERLRDSLQILSSTEREIIELLYLSDTPMTISACARILGLPRITVSRMVSRIIHKLKNAIDG